MDYDECSSCGQMFDPEQGIKIMNCQFCCRECLKIYVIGYELGKMNDTLKGILEKLG